MRFDAVARLARERFIREVRRNYYRSGDPLLGMLLPCITIGECRTHANGMKASESIEAQ